MCLPSVLLFFFYALKLILLHRKITLYAILCIVILQQLMHYHCFQATWILIAIFNIISSNKALIPNIRSQELFFSDGEFKYVVAFDLLK